MFYPDDYNSQRERVKAAFFTKCVNYFQNKCENSSKFLKLTIVQFFWLTSDIIQNVVMIN